MSAVITGVGSALPAGDKPQGRLWDEFFADRFDRDRLAAAVWSLSGVDTRHAVADPRHDDVSCLGTGSRMRRFPDEALPLGKEAVAASLEDASVAGEDVDQLVVVSCTGYATPGLDVLLARDLALPTSAERLHLGHMGCHAALPALATAADAARARGRRSVVACVELPSLHLQPAGDGPPDRDQVVAQALFADAAAAIVVDPGPAAGWELVDVVSRTDTRHAHAMTWEITDTGFRMGLGAEVPRVLGAHVAEATRALLEPHGLAVDDVAAWGVHPGGPRILETVGQRLGLDSDALTDSHATLAEHGNCSSATVLLILQRIRRRVELPPGSPIVAMAFGPGLTLQAALLRARGQSPSRSIFNA